MTKLSPVCDNLSLHIGFTTKRFILFFTLTSPRFARHFHCLLLPHACNTSAHRPSGIPGLYSWTGLSLVFHLHLIQIPVICFVSFYIQYYLRPFFLTDSSKNVEWLSYSAPPHSDCLKCSPVFMITFDFNGFLSFNPTGQTIFQVSRTMRNSSSCLSAKVEESGVLTA